MTSPHIYEGTRIADMKLSKRLDLLKPYPFVEISRIIAEKRAAGIDVVTFGIGDPDIPTPDHIVGRLEQASITCQIIATRKATVCRSSVGPWPSGMRTGLG